MCHLEGSLLANFVITQTVSFTENASGDQTRRPSAIVNIPFFFIY